MKRKEISQKKQNFENQRVLQRKSPAGCTAFLHGARRAGWLRKGSGPREGKRENAKRSTHSSEEDPAPLAAAPRKVAGAPSCDMKRDTRTKVYPTDADAKKRRNIIQSHYQRPDAKFKGTSK